MWLVDFADRKVASALRLRRKRGQKAKTGDPRPHVTLNLDAEAIIFMCKLQLPGQVAIRDSVRCKPRRKFEHRAKLGQAPYAKRS